MANALVVSVFFFCLFRSIGIASHVPWFSAIIPDALRGRYWATEGAIVSSVGVVTLLTCTALFANLSTYSAFRWVYGIAAFGSAMAVVCLLLLPAGPRPAPSPIRHMGREAVTLCFGPGLFRHYLVFALLGAFVNSSYAAFTSYYLKTEVGLASSEILSFTAVTFGGQILGAFTIRHWLDRIAIRRFFQFSNILTGAVFLFWLGVVLGEAPSIHVFAASYFAFGIAAGVSNTTHITFLPELSPVDKRPVSIAVFGAVSGIFYGLSPMIWGLALRTEGARPGVDSDNFAIFFALGIALCGAALIVLHWLPDPRIRARAEVRP
jgi:Na+/melibiose symporter-like transporter